MGRAVRRWAAATLINRNFGLFMLGTAVSGTGYWFLLVALGWLVLELGNSTFLLGLTNFAQMAPLFFLGLFGGVVTDRFNRQHIMLVGQAVTVAATLALAVVASLNLISIPIILACSLVFGLNLISIPIILACSLVFGLANSVLWPTWSVFIKDLVGAQHVRQAVALNSARFNLTRVIGPALAGVMLGTLGPAWCLWIGAVSSLGVMLTILLMRLPPWQAPPRDDRSMLSAVGEALAYVWRTPPVRRLLTVTGLIGLVAMPFQAFLPALARDSLRAGPEGLGLLTAAVGLGAVVGALGSGARVITARPAWALIGLAGGIAAGLGLLALSREVWLALLALALLGLSSIAFLSMANAGVQLGVPDALVGRVMGLWVVLNAGTQPLGSLLEGALAERWSLNATFGLAGLICALAVAWLIGERVWLRAAVTSSR